MRFDTWTPDDGGRANAGFKGQTGDCVTRALAIANAEDYRVVYDELHWMLKTDPKHKAGRSTSPRDGVPRRLYDRWLADRGWQWVPTMGIGTGCTVHLVAAELPSGVLIVRLSRHLTAVIDGMIHDTFDPSRGGTRCVYGYWHR